MSQKPNNLPANQPEVPKSKLSITTYILLAIILILACLLGYLIFKNNSAPTKSSSSKTPSQSKQNVTEAQIQSQVEGLQLDLKKNYGNKYASGVLPVGDNKYSTTEVKKGYIYTCSNYAHNLSADQGGAGTRGSWFVGTTEYDITKKAKVNGNVMWQSSFSNTVSNDTRTIKTNDLPNHPSGIFPIAKSDAAYGYDRNPNSIKSQDLTFSLPANPTYGEPNCMGGQVGIMLTGVALFNGFDAGGRDAGAWEVQDGCSGHPEKQGEYHYHTLSSCIKDISYKTVIGYALDGFPITGSQVSANNILTTDDLDNCHGLTSEVQVDGKLTTTYHYVMTQDFPYSASCFRSRAAEAPGTGQQSSQSQQPSPSQQQPPEPPPKP